MKRTLLKLSVFGLAGTMALLPAVSMAQGYYDYHQHRQQEQNQWQAIGFGSAVLGVLGLANHNDTLAMAGALGAAYSGVRYSQDRSSEYGYYGGYRQYNYGRYDNRTYIPYRVGEHSRYGVRYDRDRRDRDNRNHGGGNRDRDHDGDRD